MTMRALLMSNSTNAGGSFLEHARDALSRLLAGTSPLVFVPFALADHDGYTDEVRQALSGVVDVVGAHTLSLAQVGTASAYFVGGGNTFRLLKRLQDDGPSTSSGHASPMASRTSAPVPVLASRGRRYVPRTTCRSSSRGT